MNSCSPALQKRHSPGQAFRLAPGKHDFFYDVLVTVTGVAFLGNSRKEVVVLKPAVR